jgi:uncharacterized iron-regulated membrane protein
VTPNPAWLDSLPAAALYLTVEIMTIVVLVTGVWLWRRRRTGPTEAHRPPEQFLLTGARTWFPLRWQLVMLGVLLLALPLALWLLDHVVWPLLRYWPTG